MTPDAADEAVEHPLIGETLRGTYRVLRTLDQGGMGLVFEAEHTRLRRRVAVKVLARHLTADAQALARFNREAEIICQLQHPHIVQILDFDTTPLGEPYIVMELLRGESLAARLSRDVSLPVAEATRIVHQVASGLLAAHDASIIHRDLKPANIFLTAMPDQGTLIKLLDFGISKRVGASRALTGEFDVLGTPDYMAPEQALGKTALVDARGDQYALAVIAFEMLSGQTPFTGDSVMEVLQQVASTVAPSIHSVAPHLPAQVAAVLKRGLEKEPQDRYPTVMEFSIALSKACDCSLPPPVDVLSVALTVPASGSSLAAPRSASVPISSSPARSQPQGGSQRRAASRLGNASTLSGTATVQDIPDTLQRARQALGLGDLNLAVSYAESALRMADAFDSAEAQLLLDAEEMLIDHIFETRLGSLQHRLNVTGLPSGPTSRVSPEQAFLLSRIDSGVTVEELLDVSPLSRRETLRLLIEMLSDGFVSVLRPSSPHGH
jgi:serine/threonine protein kinase